MLLLKAVDKKVGAIPTTCRQLNQKEGNNTMNKPDFLLNITAIRSPEDVINNLNDIVKCEFPSHSNENTSWFYNVAEMPDDTRLIIPISEVTSNGVSTAGLDRVCEVFEAFSWSMGELYLSKQFTKHEDALSIHKEMHNAYYIEKDYAKRHKIYESYFITKQIELAL